MTVMKKLSDVVNVVPVIAKSDSLTMDERDLFKERIRAEMQYNNIRVYPFDNDGLRGGGARAQRTHP